MPLERNDHERCDSRLLVDGCCRDQAVVLVYTASGPNLPLARLSQLRPGQVLVEHGQTLRGGPGFGYRMLLMRRDDIKSLEGKPLPTAEK